MTIYLPHFTSAIGQLEAGMQISEPKYRNVTLLWRTMMTRTPFMS